MPTTPAPCNLSVWSPIAAAGAESTFSGILAGFVFLGMIAIWTVEHPATRTGGSWPAKRSYTLQFFSVAFIILALDSYVTAITSGESDCNRASIEEAFSGGALGIGAAVMVAGLAWLLVTLPEQVLELRSILRFMVSGLGILIVFMIALSAVGIGEQLLGKRSHTFVDATPWALGAALLVATAVAALRGFKLVRTNNQHNHGPDSVVVSGKEPHTDRLGRMVLIAAIAALADGILSALFCGAGGAISIGYWAHAPTALIDGVVVLAVLMPGIVLVAVAGPTIAAVAKDPPPGSRAMEADGAMPASPPSEVDPQSIAASATHEWFSQRQQTAAVETMTAELLRKRSLDTFSGGYLTFVAIIQGVALAVLADRASISLVEQHSTGWPLIAAIGQSASSFVALLVITYDYLWFTSVVGWPLTFTDTLVPYVLGACEIATARFIGRNSAWWISFTALAGVGTLAYLRTRVKSHAVQFAGESGKAPDIIKKLTSRQMGCCAALMAVSLVAVSVSFANHQHAEAFLALLAFVPACTAPALIVLSGRGLDELYAAFGMSRKDRGQKQLGMREDTQIQGPREVSDEGQSFVSGPEEPL